MNNDTTTKNLCEACGITVEETLTHKRWVHNDPYGLHGWAYEDGETVSGEYCHECLRDIDILGADYQRWLDETSNEPTLEDWATLACRLAMGINRAFSNWKDVANVTQREMKMLADWMGDDWQRKWH